MAPEVSTPSVSWGAGVWAQQGRTLDPRPSQQRGPRHADASYQAQGTAAAQPHTPPNGRTATLRALASPGIHGCRSPPSRRTIVVDTPPGWRVVTETAKPSWRSMKAPSYAPIASKAKWRVMPRRTRNSPREISFPWKASATEPVRIARPVGWQPSCTANVGGPDDRGAEV